MEAGTNMDAPFSNADETHIKNISAVLPEVANQVIMFVMEKDWQYAESVMNVRVGKYCKLKKNHIRKLKNRGEGSCLKEIIQSMVSMQLI